MAQVYVNTDTMQSWKNDMEKINQSCIDEINLMVKIQRSPTL